MYENLNFITEAELKINLGKTCAQLTIFPKIFCISSLKPVKWSQIEITVSGKKEHAFNF